MTQNTEQPEALQKAHAIVFRLHRSGDRQAAEAMRALLSRVHELEAQTAHMTDFVDQANYAHQKMKEAHARVQELEASQARVPLSDERVDGINRFVTGTVFGRIARGRAIARAIEAAHGITRGQG